MMITLDRSPSDLIPFLKSYPIFQGFNDTAIESISSLVTLIEADAGETIMREGDLGDCLYLVYQGQLKVVSSDAGGNEVFLNTIEAGESVGEIALIIGGRRMATVVSVTNVVLICLTRDAVSALASSYPKIEQQITSNLWARLEQAQINRTLYVSRLLERLDEAALQDLRSELELVHLPGGELLMRQGEASSDLYIVISGKLHVAVTDKSGEETALIELGRGETVGEIGVLTGDRRIANVYAGRDSMLARLSQNSFYRLMAKHPHAMTQQFVTSIIDRLKGQVMGTIRPTSSIVTLAVVPSHSGAPLKEFTKQLVDALSQIGRTLYLNADRLASILTQPGVAYVDPDSLENIPVLRWLAEQESIFRFIVYEADPSYSAWTERCMRQADRILMVGEAGAPAMENPVKRIEAKESGGWIITKPALVLLHPPSTERPVGTMRWRKMLAVDRHYHARMGVAGDFARLARLLTGQGVGLVLSGGGARGTAYIGAIRALHEANIPIDVIGGTSMGGLIACQHGMGWDYETVMEKSRQAIARKFDFTFPITAIMAGGEMTKLTRDMFGDTQMEDLWLPCFCITANLTSYRLMVHTKGPVWKYVRATTSLPGILPPVIDDGEMLVDGGILNNLPTDVMRERDDVGLIIAFEVGAPNNEETQQEPPYESVLSGWQVLARRLNPFSKSMPVPAISEIMMAIVSISDARALKTTRELADFYARLSIDQASMLQFDELENIVTNGYRSAKEAIAEWQQTGELNSLPTRRGPRS